jgi:hypothetical protein
MSPHDQNNSSIHDLAAQEVKTLNSEIMAAGLTTARKAIRIGELLDGLQPNLRPLLQWLKANAPFAEITGISYLWLFYGDRQFKAEIARSKRLGGRVTILGETQPTKEILYVITPAFNLLEAIAHVPEALSDLSHGQEQCVLIACGEIAELSRRILAGLDQRAGRYQYIRP